MKAAAPGERAALARLQAGLFASNATQAERIGLKAMAARMRAAAARAQGQAQRNEEQGDDEGFDCYR